MQARTILVATAALLLAAALPATADTLITVKCTTGDLSTIQEFAIECHGNAVNWVLSDPIDIMAGDVLLATIKELGFQSDVEPYVNLRFAVEAGATDTTFDISSAVVSFDPLMDVVAYASAGVTLTSNADGAMITGLFDDGMSYEARYNSSTVFADLVAGFSISGDDTVTHRDRKPASGYDPIAGTVSSIQSEFKFILSALDQASGTSRFEALGVAVPEPATMGLLALGGLALIRRRR